MKDYELTVVFHPDLEMNLDPALDKVKKALEQAGGTITKEEDDGKKRLTYTIKSQDFGLYYYFEVQLPPDAPLKLNAIFNITDEVLRYLLVHTDARKAKMEARRKARDGEAEAEAEGEAEAETETESNQEKGE